MELKSFSQLDTELTHLRRLYEMGAYSFLSTQNYITYQIKLGKIDAKKPLSNRYANLEDNAEIVRDYLKNHSTEYLRELIFIRIISALETFFTDTLRDVFVHTSEPFKRQDATIEFNVGEILSSKSIDDLQNRILVRDRRKLTSGGISETEKYYRKIFEVDFNNYGHRYKKVKEFYDRRHLFVHSLGLSENGVKLIAKTDRKYKIEYSTDKRELDISEDYLLDCISEIRNFSSYIHTDIISKITKPQWKEKDFNDEPKNSLNLIIEVIDNNLKEFDPQFKFRIGEHVYSLANFLKSFDKKDGYIELKLVGWEGALNNYYRLIKQLKVEGKIGKIKGNFDGREWQKE